MQQLEALIKSNRYLSTTLELPDLNNIQISGVTSRSSECRSGSLFVAKKGATPKSQDGHDYIQHALSLGAIAVVVDQSFKLLDTLLVPVIRAVNSARALAVLCEAYWGYPSRKLTIIGVTGTNGKTSTSFMLHSIFKTAGFKTKIIGTLGMGDPGELIALSHTTMEPEFLSPVLADMASKQVTHVILETSSHGLVLERVSGLAFAAVGLTNISEDHLDFHATKSNYIKAKQKLFDDLASDHTYKIVPHQHDFEPKVEKLCNFFLYDPQKKPAGLALPGDFQINNASLAQKIALCLGVGKECIQEGLKRCVPIPGRLQAVNNKRCQIFIDFAHTPDALACALKTVRKLSTGRVILVFGCGGERDEFKRPLMGHIAQDLADLVIITDDNPRGEDPQAIRRAIMQDHSFTEIPDRAQAIKTAIISSKPEDLVLIAGKGHEDYQIYGQHRLSFSDYSTALEVLEIVESL